jgi:drug/metabolite transporter (DMT)-like permease
VLGLVLGLSSSVCWGVADFLGGTQARQFSVLRVLLISQGVGLAGVAVVVVARGRGAPALEHLLPAIGGGVAGIAALSAFYRALAIGTMSIVAPIAATSAVVPVVVGIAGGDNPGAVKVIGIAVAIVGVVLASREEDSGRRRSDLPRASIALAIVAALGFGTFFVGLRESARSDVLWALFSGRAAGFAALAVAVLVLRPPGGVPGRRLPLLVLIGTLDVGANGLYSIATRHGLLSVVAVASSLYPLATVLLARTVLRERVRRTQELGVAVALAGVVLIAVG